jgi:hypothetical protein
MDLHRLRHSSSVNTRSETCDMIVARPRMAKIWPIAKFGAPARRTRLTSHRRRWPPSRPCSISRCLQEDRNPQAGSLAKNVRDRNDDHRWWRGEERRVLHVMDLNATRDVQCPPLLQAIAWFSPIRDTLIPGLAGVETANKEVGAGGDCGGILPL